MRLSVVISTYDSEDWLRKVLVGYRGQTWRDFEVIVADDGSGAATRALVESFAADYPVALRHLWHEDAGYRRQEILNKAILAAGSDYLVFTDGDCIPRADFLAVHAANAEPGRFLSGGYCKLGMPLSRAIGADDIASGRCFDLSWLNAAERMGRSNTLKLGAGATLARFLDAATPTRATFNNCNSSAWKRDLLAVNGYDERMKYGGADRELGERLANRGIRGKQVRHRAVCVHLDHARGYKTEQSLRANRAIRERTRVDRAAWTDYGIEKAAVREAA